MTEDIPERSEFDSVDPAPPSSERSVADLRTVLCNEDEKMFQRMRALFALRNIGGKDSVEALAAAYESKSALLKHEIAYVMGQMQDPHAVPHLIERLEDGEEDQVQETLEYLELDKWICVDVKDDISFEYPFLPDLLGGDYCTYVFHYYGN